MKRLFVLSLLTLATVACSTVPSSSARMSSTEVSSAAAPRESPTHYILLSQPNAIREIDWSRRINDLHVKGRLTSIGFAPTGKVEGNGKLCTDGTDWLSFDDMRVHSSGDGTPKGAHLMGCRAGSVFTPSSRDIAL